MPMTTEFRREFERLRPAVFERDGDTCTYCGQYDATHVDHKIPRSRGGENTLENLVTACRDCNTDKMAFTVEEWQEWREENGLPWPPLSKDERLVRLSTAIFKCMTPEQREEANRIARTPGEYLPVDRMLLLAFPREQQP